LFGNSIGYAFRLQTESFQLNPDGKATAKPTKGKYRAGLLYAVDESPAWYTTLGLGAQVRRRGLHAPNSFGFGQNHLKHGKNIFSSKL